MSQSSAFERVPPFLRVFVALMATAGFVACGGGTDTVGEVCSASSARVFAQCDQSDPDDQDIIRLGLANIGIAVSNQQISTASPGDLTNLCTAELEGAEISGSDSDEFRSLLSETFGCQNVVNLIVNAVNSL